MTLPVSGQISFSDINVELGLNSNAQISLNDAVVRTLLNKSTGVISLDDAHDKSNVTASTLQATLTIGGAYFPPEGGMWMGYRSGYGGSLLPSQLNNGYITQLDYDLGVRFYTELKIVNVDPPSVSVKKGANTYIFSRISTGLYRYNGDPLSIQSGGTLSLEISF